MTISRSSFAVLALLLAAGVGYFSILPQWKMVGSLRTQIRDLQALREELGELIRIRDRLAVDYEKISPADAAKLRAIVPRGPQPSSLVVDAETVAQRSGVALAQVNVAASLPAQATLELPTSRATPLPVSFTILGTHASLQTFLANLERSRRIVDVTDLSFAPGAGGVIPVTVQARAYYRP